MASAPAGSDAGRSGCHRGPGRSLGLPGIHRIRIWEEGSRERGRREMVAAEVREGLK